MSQSPYYIDSSSTTTTTITPYVGTGWSVADTRNLQQQQRSSPKRKMKAKKQKKNTTTTLQQQQQRECKRIIAFKNRLKREGLTEEVFDKYPDLALMYTDKLTQFIATWKSTKKQL